MEMFSKARVVREASFHTLHDLIFFLFNQPLGGLSA
jgi:hypothetical protein